VIKSSQIVIRGRIMKKIRLLILALTIFLGMTVTLGTVQASGMGYGPNTGDYVYQDREYITNAQYDRLASINDKIDRDVRPQRLYVIILDSHRFDNDLGGNSSFIMDNIVDVIGQDSSDDYGQALFGKKNPDYIADGNSFKNNFLIYSLKSHQLLFAPSENSNSYLTDLKIWRYRFWLQPSLKFGNEDAQVAAVMKMADKLGPKLEKVSQKDHDLHSADYRDVTNVAGFFILVAAFLILAMAIIYYWNDNHTSNGSGPEEDDNPDYDAGFDEGAYYGSHMD